MIVVLSNILVIVALHDLTKQYFLEWSTVGFEDPKLFIKLVCHMISYIPFIPILMLIFPSYSHNIPTISGLYSQNIPIMISWYSLNVSTTWRFPEIGLPPVIIHFNAIFQYKPAIFWGLSIYGPPHPGLESIRTFRRWRRGSRCPTSTSSWIFTFVGPGS